MKKLGFMIFIFLILIGIGALYYLNVDDNFHTIQEFNDFPVPGDAALESENEIARNYTWQPSSGTSLPINYRLVIKKSGWKEVEIDGHGITYEKDGRKINVTVATDYIGISKVQNNVKE